MGNKTKLESFYNETNEFQQNRMLLDWLRDDNERAALYRELETAEFPVLRFKSVLRSGGASGQSSYEDAYLVSSKNDIAVALQHYSVQPYASLDSGGRFMLGLDDPKAHKAQRDAALEALKFTPVEYAACAREAVKRALVLPLKNYQFDLVTQVAEQAALRFVALLFGLPPEAHVELSLAMGAAYKHLTFQIIGRHFAAEAGLAPSGSSEAVELKSKLEAHVRNAILTNDQDLQDKGLPQDTVIGKLLKHYGSHAEEPVFVALGLMAGTIGNVKAAIAIAIDHFFSHEVKEGRRLVDEATLRARGPDPKALETLIFDVLAAMPAAPFLARAVRGQALMFKNRDGHSAPIPEGANVLLAMGAEAGRDLMFGGSVDDPMFPHSCVGRYLAKPLVVETIRQVLVLPGLSRVIDAGSGKPFRLEKRWGSICESFPLQYQRDRCLNQRPLHVVLRIKPPVAENALKLRLLTVAGAHIVEEALRNSGHVHFAWFNLVENDTHLAMSTVYDGDFDAYVEHFALKVPLFDEQFKYLEDAPPTPIRDHPKEFVATIHKYNKDPLGGYFFSAYPHVAVSDIRHAGLDKP